MIGEQPPNELLSEFLSIEQLKAIPRPRPLVEGLLNMNSLAWIAGPPGSYKTFLALDLALHVSSGQNYLGRPVTGQRVAYLAGEGLSGLSARVEAWSQASKLPAREAYFLPRAIPVTTQEWYVLCDALRTMRVGMVVVDTQARHSGGLDENDAPAMSRLVQSLDAVRVATGGCVATVHHSSKAGSALRGSTALQGAADTVLTTEVQDGVVTVHNLKQKDMAQACDYWLRPVETGPSCVLVECEQPEQPDTRSDGKKPYSRRE